MSLGGQDDAGIGDFERRQFLPYNQPEPMPLPSGNVGADPYSQIMGQMGGGDPYSQIMSQMPVRQNPYAYPSGGALGGYDPRMYNNAFTGSNSRLNLSGLLGGGGSVNYGDGGTGVSSNPGWESMTPAQQAGYYAANPTMATITQMGQGLFGNTSLGLLQNYFNPGFVSEQGLIAMGVNPAAYQNAIESFRGSEIAAMNAGYPSAQQNNIDAGMAVASDAEAAAQQDNNVAAGMAAAADAEAVAADAAAGGGGGDGGSKIVCTAMNQEYGFGSFRNAVWLKYSESKLTKAHEVGYHALFLPLVDFGFKQGDGKVNLMVRKFLESCARHRSLDLRAEMRGTKRDPIGRAYRFVLEPLCYAVGKFKGY